MPETEKFLQNTPNFQHGELSHLNDEQKIQEILQQQQKLQQLYNEVVLHIQHYQQSMSSEDLFKYQAQLKQLSEQYQKNQEQLKILGYSTVQVNKEVFIKNWERKNLSLKSLAIGCGAILFFLIIGLIILFFYLVQNPSQLSGLSGLGITATTAKTLLQGMTFTAMLVVILLGIVIIIMNIYKAFTVQNRSKIWYYFGIMLGVFILGLALGAGTKVLGEVGKIEVESVANPDQNVLGFVYVPKKDNPNATMQLGPKTLLIAPVNVGFKFLQQNFNTFAKLKLPGKNITNLELDCGNGQKLPYLANSQNLFNGACFLTKKGDYQINLIVHYAENGVNKQEIIPISPLKVASELAVSVSSNKKIETWANEYIVWPLPTEVTFNADQIFRDLGLRNYHINWDGNGDGIVDKTNESNFVFEYDRAEVYYPNFTLPDVFLDVIFSFPLRVEKSLTPVCSFDFQQKKVNDYQISVSFFDGGERFIEDYSYLVYDASTNTLLDTIYGKDVGMDFSHRFPGRGTYIVKMNFVTTEGKQGVCEGEVKLQDKASYQVDYDILFSTPRMPSFQKVEMSQIVGTKTISLSEVPTKVKLKINTIDPATYNTTVQVTFDGRPVVETQLNEFLFDIRDSGEHKIAIKIEDKVRGLLYEEELSTKIGLDDIIGDLKLIGEESGFSPLTVTLDASATKLNDIQDEIAYFSWDFGDGAKKDNLSNAVIKHTYYYDVDNNNGIFHPKVSVYTKNGRSLTFGLSQPIVVKKQLIQLNLYSSSHPTQEARLGDNVLFTLDFNGLPSKINRYFKEGDLPISCNGRECIEMRKTFEEVGTYTIKASVEFDDGQSAEQTMLFRVR